MRNIVITVLNCFYVEQAPKGLACKEVYTILTLVPTPTKLNSSITSLLYILMQP